MAIRKKPAKHYSASKGDDELPSVRYFEEIESIPQIKTQIKLGRHPLTHYDPAQGPWTLVATSQLMSKNETFGRDGMWVKIPNDAPGKSFVAYLIESRSGKRIWFALVID